MDRSELLSTYAEYLLSPPIPESPEKAEGGMSAEELEERLQQELELRKEELHVWWWPCVIRSSIAWQKREEQEFEFQKEKQEKEEERRQEDLDQQRQRDELELQRREEENQRRDRENDIREMELQRQS